MFDGLLKRKFFDKCKLAARMTKLRLEMIMKRRIAMQKFLKNDIADLLKNGLDKNAYGRAEGYLIEQNMTSCYEYVENCILQILKNVVIMSKQSECPQDCNEAVSSLIFAAARFADLPDLRELRKIFIERYGKTCDSYANKEFVNKLKLVPPTMDMKLQLMQDIAQELGVPWNRIAAEEKFFNHLPQDSKQVNSSASRNNDEGHGVAPGPSKAKPISVRRIRSKNDYDEDNVGVSSARKADQDSNHSESDEEERILDKMLIRQSLKKSSSWETESDQKPSKIRHGSCNVGTSKVEARKVPDYDDLVARLAAFRDDI